MQADLVEMLVAGLRMDNALLAQSVALGESVPLAEIVEVAAATRALFNSVTLASRDSSFRVDQCLKLWIETRKVFEELHAQWENVPTDNGAIRFHLVQLDCLRELSASREQLYTISQSERLEHASRRADTSETSYGCRYEHPAGAGLADKESFKSGPVHIYSLGRI